MSDSVSVASKYGAFFRALCREGFDETWAYELTRIAFSTEASGHPTLGPSCWPHEELVGSDAALQRKELFEEFVGKLTAIGGDDE